MAIAIRTRPAHRAVPAVFSLALSVVSLIRHRDYMIPARGRVSAVGAVALVTERKRRKDNDFVGYHSAAFRGCFLIQNALRQLGLQNLLHPRVFFISTPQCSQRMVACSFSIPNRNASTERCQRIRLCHDGLLCSDATGRHPAPRNAKPGPSCDWPRWR